MSTPVVVWKLLYGLTLAGAMQPAASPPPEVVVRASAARPAIERILRADNLDVEHLPARDVADIMSDIPRGGAPIDFWTACQAHVRAWQDYADAKERARRASPTDIDSAPDGAAIADARKRISSTFGLVEKIARQYGARLPARSGQ
jgi:hypothetical protein